MIIDTVSAVHEDSDSRSGTPLANPPRPLVRVLKSAQRQPRAPGCFRTEARLSCCEWDCPRREDCCRLVAEWRR